MARVFIADDHPFLRDGIKALLNENPGLDVVGEAEDGKSAIEQILLLKPDLAIIDISMPKVDGIEVARKIANELPQTKVLIFSMHQDHHYAAEALKSGASGYVIKGSDSDELLSAIDKVLSGKRYLSPPIADKMLNEYVINKGAADPFDALSQREIEVLSLILNGVNRTKIAEDLDISEFTIKKHRANIMKKLNVGNMADLVKIGIRKGLIKIED
ncbi:MAG: response regulator transcription factor [Deltaproteobacteria bacterium]|nr:response regulator transcription factor [Deltaproteobacteria bacterium]